MNPKDELLFGELLELIQRTDGQIASTNQFYFTAIGSLIPIIALLVTVDVNEWVYIGICVLATALGLHWLMVNTKLTLLKYCWIEMARDLESKLFEDTEGPFTRQKSFFDNLDKHRVTWVDRLLVRGIGTKRFSYIPIVLLILAVVAAVITAFVANVAP